MSSLEKKLSTPAIAIPSKVTANTPNAINICALYKFVSLDAFEALREPLANKMANVEVKGTLLLAVEGINGTIAGPQAGIDTVLAFLSEQPGLDNISHKES